MENKQYREGFEDAKNGYPPLRPGPEYFRGYFAGRKEYEEGEKK
jgi:hypothetical protein